MKWKSIQRLPIIGAICQLVHSIKENKVALTFTIVAFSQSLSTYYVAPFRHQCRFMKNYRDVTEKRHTSFELCVSTRGQIYKPSKQSPLLFKGENQSLPNFPVNSPQSGINQTIAAELKCTQIKSDLLSKMPMEEKKDNVSSLALRRQQKSTQQTGLLNFTRLSQVLASQIISSELLPCMQLHRIHFQVIITQSQFRFTLIIIQSFNLYLFINL